MDLSFASAAPRRSRWTRSAVSLDDYRACLKDLATVNRPDAHACPILRWLDQPRATSREASAVTVLDVGYGYGDLLRKIHRLEPARNRTVELIGVDLNPMSEPIAARARRRPAWPSITGPATSSISRPNGPSTSSSARRRRITCRTTSLRSSSAGWSRRRRAAGTSPTFTAIPCHFISSASCPGRALASLRPPRRTGLDRPQLPARGMGAHPGSGRGPAGAAQIRWHVPFRLCVSRLK